MLTLQGITYAHPNRDVLFDNLSIVVNKQDRIALTGNNGSGKSTLLKIIAGELIPLTGQVKTTAALYYVPQIFGQFNEYTIAGALRIAGKLQALKDILAGCITEENITLLDDDWTVEERARTALARWGLVDADMDQKMHMLSGGQKTKVFLAGIDMHQPEIVLLDEPSNHLDAHSRSILYNYIRTTNNTLLVVSHDRTLLNLLDTVFELDKKTIIVYGGNYDFYKEQKLIESEALNRDLKSTEKALRKAREVEREALERQQKLDARGKRKQEKAGVPTIAMNTLRNNAEKSTAKTRDMHEEKVDGIARELEQLRKELPAINEMKFGLGSSGLHRGKTLIAVKNINFEYHDQPLWQQPLNFQIVSGMRIAIKGANGSGKTTLIRMILGELQPQWGTLDRAETKTICIDQDYSLIDNNLTVYEQAQCYNSGVLQEHEIKIRLTRFLFTKNYWDKPCSVLSGGEKMRLMLCTLTIGGQAPDIIILDEPTNNLDIQNIEILTAAVSEYQGTLIVVSHDEYFLNQISVKETIRLEV